MTASSQASKTVPSGADNASCSISSASANARRTSASCLASTSIITFELIEHPCSGVKKPSAPDLPNSCDHHQRSSLHPHSPLTTHHSPLTTHHLSSLRNLRLSPPLLRLTT